MKPCLHAVVVISVGLGASGCERKSEPVPVSVSQADSQAGRAQTPPPSVNPAVIPPTTAREGAIRDGDITDQVLDAIKTDAALSEQARKVSVSTLNGVVTLKGDVPAQSDREIIHAKASRIPTVIRVDDLISVQPAKTP